LTHEQNLYRQHQKLTGNANAKTFRKIFSHYRQQLLLMITKFML